MDNNKPLHSFNYLIFLGFFSNKESSLLKNCCNYKCTFTDIPCFKNYCFDHKWRQSHNPISPDNQDLSERSLAFEDLADLGIAEQSDALISRVMSETKLQFDD